MRPWAVNKPLIFMSKGTHFRPVKFCSDAVAVPPSADVQDGNLDLVHVGHEVRAGKRRRRLLSEPFVIERDVTAQHFVIYLRQWQGLEFLQILGYLWNAGRLLFLHEV